MTASGPREKSALKIVLIHRYFHPDTPPYASILREIALALANRNAEVTVLTCQPSYNRAVVSTAPRHEQIATNVEVTRWPVLDDRRSRLTKIVNLVGFSVRLVLALVRMERVDVVMVSSTPPVVLAMVVSLVARAKKARFVYHKQDIYPEVVDGTYSVAGPLRGVLRALDAMTDRRSDRVVVLSEDMALTTMARSVCRDHIAVLNNFDPWRLDDKDRPKSPRSGPVRIAYAGNLGHFQNFEAIFAALRHFRGDNRCRFDFIGDGPLRANLESLVADCELDNVTVHGYLDPIALARMLRESFDVGIVSLHPGAIRAAYPSKTMSYLRNGLPVLALVEADTELAEMLDRYRAGWQADPSIPGALERSLETIIRDRRKLEEKAVAARAMYNDQFAPKRQLEKWADLFEKLGRGD